MSVPRHSISCPVVSHFHPSRVSACMHMPIRGGCVHFSISPERRIMMNLTYMYLFFFLLRLASGFCFFRGFIFMYFVRPGSCFRRLYSVPHSKLPRSVFSVLFFFLSASTGSQPLGYKFFYFILYFIHYFKLHYINSVIYNFTFPILHYPPKVLFCVCVLLLKTKNK